MSNEYQRTGIMLYCFQKDEGCLIIGNKIPPKINEKTHMNQWEDVGTFKIDRYGIVTLFPEDPEWLKDLSGGWRESYFLVNIYDENVDLVTLPKHNGMVLKCFETDEICFLLSEKIPMKGLDTISKRRRPSSEWEDIGTFHLENNMLVYHGEEPIPHGDIFDANLRKINIPSY